MRYSQETYIRFLCPTSCSKNEAFNSNEEKLRESDQVAATWIFSVKCKHCRHLMF